MQKRIARLYPMIALGVAISAALAYAEGKAGIATTSIATMSAAALVLFPISLVTGGVLAFPINLPMWSLFFEMAGSVGYGLERNRLSQRALVALVAMAGCVLAATMFAGHVQNFGVGGREAFLVGFPRMIYPFAIGVLFARIAIKVPSIKDWQLALILLAIFAAPSGRLFAGMCCIAILPAIVLLGSAAVSNSPAWDWLGRISYPLYLLHVPILDAARYFLAGWPLWFVIPLAVGFAVSASVLALVFFDEPVRAWLGRYSAKVRVAT
jgi:peptidoglycan/LPS O-acetylase OafA/YrhL